MSTNNEVLFLVHGDTAVHQLQLHQYPAGEPLIRDGLVPSRMLLRPKNLEVFMTALFWVDSLRERGYEAPHLILPYVPGARQDRLLEQRSDQLFTVKSVARELNLRNFPSVTVLDPHSYVAPALIDRCRVVPSVECFRSLYNAWDGIIAPDGGAEKRAGAVAQLLGGLPLFHAWKERDPQTGTLTGFGCEPIIPHLKSLLIVDDICDGGGTFIGLADHLRRRDRFGGTLDLFTTHGFYTKGTVELLKFFSRLITTDSVVTIPHGPEILFSSLNLLTGGHA